MFTRPWKVFSRDRLSRIVEHSSQILDIGGGLRIDTTRNNRLDPDNLWLLEKIKEKNISYRVLDYVDTFHPDIVGDIQALPLADASQQALICIAVLEHVENPILAAQEMYRVLKPGGYCFVYVPFLYYYHAEKGYYGDFWRFTDDTLRSLFKSFSTIELCQVRGAIETLVRLTPLGRFALFADLAFLLDKLTGKLASKQTSGYFVYLQK